MKMFQVDTNSSELFELSIVLKDMWHSVYISQVKKTIYSATTIFGKNCEG